MSTTSDLFKPSRTDWEPLDRHRGPFVLRVLRHTPRRKYPFQSQLLPGTVARWDVKEEAHALLTDPRDTIESVTVYSEPEQKHITTYRRTDVAAKRGRR